MDPLFRSGDSEAGPLSLFEEHILPRGCGLVQVSQIRRRFASGPAGETPPVSPLKGRNGAASRIKSRVEVWRGGLGRCLCSLLARSFGCGCHIISTMLRFHTPLIKPGGRISRTRLSDKACVIAIFPLRRQRRLVHGGAGRVSGVSQPVSGVNRLAPIFRLSSPFALGLELRPLPQGLRTRISRLGALGKLGLPLLYSQAGQESNAFCSIDRQDHTTSSGTSAP